MPPLPALTPVPFAEAIAWARARQVVLPESYYGQLQGLARSMAFSVAGIAKLDQLQTVLDSLAANLESGESFGQWKKRVREGEIPLDLPAHRIENIFRTNTQGHYGRGRCEQQKRTLADRPYFLYDAVNDSRVRLTHAAMDGFVARYDDPTWRVWTPPAGYQCVLPDTRVMGNMRVGLKAWYAGKAVEIHAASGVAVTVTANHPVLTRRGWVRAQQIQKGDDLLCYLPGMERSVASVSLRKSARTTGVIDNQKAPPRAEEVFEALAAQRLGTLPAAAFNLYGDALALKSDVYVAGADSVLMDAGLTDVSQRRENFMLQRRNHVAVSCRDKALNAAGSTLISCFSQGESKFTQALFDKWARYVQILRNLLGRLFRVKPLRQRFIQARYGSLTSAFPGSLALTLNQAAILFQGRPLQRFCLTTAAQDNALALEPVTNGLTADTKVVANRLEAFASGVATNQGLGIFRTPAQHFNRAPAPNYPGILNRARFDAAVAEQSVEKAATDFALFEQLAHSGTRQVQIDQVVGIRDFAFSGHVYDFETENGLLTANGIITSNCRCRRISLSEAQAQRFIEADAKRLAKDPELAQARASAQPDKGWDYDPCAEPDEGLRRAWGRWVGKAHPLLAEIAQAMDAQLQAAMAAFEAARQDCLAFGKANNRERLILLDEKSGKELTRDDGNVNSVKFTPTMLSLLDDEKQLIRLIHNHPSDNPLSKADYLTLSRPGVSGIEAAGHAGSRYSAMVGPNGRLDAQKFKEVMDAIDEAIYTEMRPLATSENLKFLQWAHYHFFALALDELGIIRYSPILTAEKVEALTKFKSLADRGIAAAKRGAQGAL